MGGKAGDWEVETGKGREGARMRRGGKEGESSWGVEGGGDSGRLILSLGSKLPSSPPPSSATMATL